MEHINIAKGIVTSTGADIQPGSHYTLLSYKLRAARLAWMNARYMVSLANKGEVNKSQAFKLLNQVRREYKATIKLTEACLGMSKVQRVVQAATEEYIDTVNLSTARIIRGEYS